jgi:type IV fimbrial biogenesis protein FimT
MNQHRLPAYRHQGGFTLFEQILAGMITITLACMAAPAMAHLLSRSRLQAAQLDLVSALHHTRALAATTGRRTMLCPTRDGQRCVSDQHWEGGWLIGHYRTGQSDLLHGKPLLTGPRHEQVTILSTAGRPRVRFQSDGSAGGSTVTFTLCLRGRADGALSVAVSNSGRIRNAEVKPENVRDCAKAG